MIGKTVFDVLPRAVSVVGGSVRLVGEDLLAMGARERRRLIARTSAFIPQDPLTAFNPVRRVGGADHRSPDGRARPLAGQGTRACADASQRSAHQGSGARARQLPAPAFRRDAPARADRSGFRGGAEAHRRGRADDGARCDGSEADPAAHREMQARHGTALLFVTHDLGVVAKICQNVQCSSAGGWWRTATWRASSPPRATPTAPR